MKVENSSYIQRFELNQKNIISLSKNILDDAKNLKILPDQTAVIFGNETIAIDNKNLDALKKEFKNDFIDYDGIVIAKDNANNYLKKLSDYVNNDLNVANADGNKDGLITVSESLDIKNIISADGKSFLKPRDVLSEKELREIEKETTVLMTTADIFNIHIELDKNQDGKITPDEIGKSENTGQSGNKDILGELYQKQRELFKQVAQLSSVTNPSDDQISKLNTLNSQLQGVNAQISEILKQREKMQ